MTNYYWIIAQHSGKVLEVKDGSLCSYVEIIQHKGVDMQLWYFNGGFIVNKRSCFVLDAAGWKCQNGELFSEYYFVSLIPQLKYFNYHKGTKIIQYQKQNEPAFGQEWEYSYKDNFIHLKFNRNFVLDVSGAKTDNSTNIHLWEKHGGKNQQFILQKNFCDNFKIHL
ncbi:unnamed protein product [Rhizophagus irregularis]|nr:unnamed protein product [Rhizophagus irregularis]